MIDEEIANVEFWVANTDKQALSTSKSLHRLILGQEITGGLGAGGEPEIGEQAAEASVDDIREIVMIVGAYIFVFQNINRQLGNIMLTILQAM